MSGQPAPAATQQHSRKGGGRVDEPVARRLRRRENGARAGVPRGSSEGATPGASFSVAGLFAGIGGLERGLAEAGGESALLCEWWDPARRVLAARLPGRPVVGDVRELRSPPEVDVVTAGFPCTDPSQAERRIDLAPSPAMVAALELADAEGPRSALEAEFAAILRGGLQRNERSAGSAPLRDRRKRWSERLAGVSATMLANELRRHCAIRRRLRIAPAVAGTGQETFCPLGYRSGKRIDVVVADEMTTVRRAVPRAPMAGLVEDLVGLANAKTAAADVHGPAEDTVSVALSALPDVIAAEEWGEVDELPLDEWPGSHR